MTDKTEIDYMVYSPHSAYNPKLDPDGCARSVADGGRSVGHHQCGNKAVEDMGGYGWCSIHAREVKRRLGINDEATVTKFIVVGRSQIGAFIEKVAVVKETEKSLTVASVKEVYGHREHYSQVIKKAGIRVYDSEKDALEAMVVILRTRIDHLMREVQHYNDEIGKIESALKETKP